MRKKSGVAVVSGRYAKNLKLSRGWRGDRRGRVEEGEGAYGKPKAPRRYNLKTHSAFKLLTMAAGYKVLCHNEEEVARVAGGGGTSAIQKFDLFERRLRTARRRDGGQIGGRF